jgi:hypothetical protein
MYLKKREPVRVIKQENIKYICTECGHVEKRTLFDRIVFTICRFAGITGFLFLIFLIIFSHGEIGGLLPIYVQTLKYNTAYEKNFDLKIAVAPPVKSCITDEDCIIIKMAEFLKNETTYVLQGDNMEQDPITTLQVGGGNCEDLSILAAGALRQFGIMAFVNCKIKYRHCFVTAYPAGKDYFYIIDLTKDISFIEKLDIGVDPWSVYDKHIEYEYIELEE